MPKSLTRSKKPAVTPAPLPELPTLVMAPMPPGQYKEVSSEALEKATGEGWRVICPVPTVEEDARTVRDRRATSQLLEMLAWQMERNGASSGSPLYIHGIDRLIGAVDEAEPEPVRVTRLRYLVWRPLDGDPVARMSKLKDEAEARVSAAEVLVNDLNTRVDKVIKDTAAKDVEIAKLKNDNEKLQMQWDQSKTLYEGEKRARSVAHEALGRLWRHVGEDTMKRILGPTAQNPVPVTPQEQMSAHQRLLDRD